MASLPRGFRGLMAAQFLSALADHTLLIVTIAHLQHLREPDWWAPLLKFSFTLAYVVLAPFIGVLADAICKRRLMVWMNALKLLAAAALLYGAPPLLAFALVGLGAAVYAPAKYGLLTESVSPSQLVAANGWLESTVVLSVLLGTALGGLLISPLWLQAEAVQQLAGSWPLRAGASAPGLNVSLAVVIAGYVLAACCHLAIVPSGARYPRRPWHPAALWTHFWRAQVTLWQDRSGGLSLRVTMVVWGLGALLQFAVLHWSVQVLGLGLDQAAWLQAVVAVGVVLGAVWVATRVRLQQATRVLPLGWVMALVLAASVWVSDWRAAVPALLVLGLLGGMLVVPMNALLQHRGYRLLTAGQSIAVQGFNENLSILLMLGLYAGLLALQLPVRAIMLLAALALAVFVLRVLGSRSRSRRRTGLQTDRLRLGLSGRLPGRR